MKVNYSILRMPSHYLQTEAEGEEKQHICSTWRLFAISFTFGDGVTGVFNMQSKPAINVASHIVNL